MRHLLILTIFTFFSVTTFSQEILIDLQSIPVKKSTLTKSKVSVKAAPLSLPFYDDFSNGQSSPSLLNWLPNAVLVNQTYAVNQPTIGVATFDAIGSNGKIYSHLTTILQKADSLTSRPINLSTFVVGDSLYLSFQYQPKGLGEAPDTTDNQHLGCDSLAVEFFSALESKWVRVFSVSAYFKGNKVSEKHHLSNTTIIQKASDISKHFFCAMIPIKEDRFLKDTFQFKIINYASLSSYPYPSILGNSDHWHIDLVYLNVGRDFDSKVIEDVSFSKPVKSFLKNYESMPWKHFNSQAKLTELTNPLSFKNQIINHYSYTQNVTIDFQIKDLSNQTPLMLFTGGANNYEPLQTFDLLNPFEYSIESNWDDSAKYLLKSQLTTESGENYLRWNDTVSYIQKFYNYYAYDDGSAEFGYGLWGEGSQNSMIAVKYHSYEIDSLKGVLFYFNEIPDFIRTNFELVVWNDNNGKPGTQLYKKTVYKPLYTYNADTLYIIDAKFKIGGDFWVGTINNTEDLLNIGFDKNNDHSNKLFYNRTGTWQQSSENGSLMIKPVFGKFTSWQTGVDKPIAETKFSIYPNPAKSSIRLNIPEGSKPEWVRIINLSGQVMMSRPYDSNSIDISSLQTGIYLFQLTQNNKNKSTQKLVIIR